ncbi:MipA/OmpV family protein [Rhodoferax sp. U11-2br]|uniref:MipA/OmpV family protein n=1 Tax=Rhodoferax sp. U11-2br TaxID=2838878 RepID=UPI001BEA93FD|nr:MipA/OmpV family protein [Rhodoferax sp. U11-2br]MBT3068837.1 MipA/OmpV family protein [Rhodoferax sp. U11-2br]
MGVGVSDSVYAGEGTKSTLLPLIQYQGERFFLRGLTAGAHLYRSQTFGLDAIASARMDGIKVEDFGVQELAKNGINRSLLVDRDGGVDMGLAASWRSSVGKFELIAKADVTGTSEGFEVEAKYGYDFMMWSGKLTPNVGVSYLSKDMANYYYGTLDAEVARGVVDYKPGAATIPKIGLTYARPVGEDWTFITSVKYQFLPSKISDSPLLKSSANGEASFMFGLSRSF